MSHYQALSVPNILQEMGKLLSVRKWQSKIKEEWSLEFHTMSFLANFIELTKNLVAFVEYV